MVLFSIQAYKEALDCSPEFHTLKVKMALDCSHEFNCKQSQGLNGPRRKKTYLQGLRPGHAQISSATNTS